MRGVRRTDPVPAPIKPVDPPSAELPSGDQAPVDHLLPAPVSPAVTPPGARRFQIDLRDHEGGRYQGHSIARHVGKSQEAIGRIMDIPIGTFPSPSGMVIQYRETHGTFSSLERANSLVNGVLSANAESVDAFLKSDKRKLFIESFGKRITGMEGYRKTGLFTKKPPLNYRDTYGVRVILTKDKSRPNGFQIITAFPTNN